MPPRTSSSDCVLDGCGAAHLGVGISSQRSTSCAVPRRVKIIMAAFALAGVLPPGIGKAIKIDAVIHDYAEAAAKFKIL